MSKKYIIDKNLFLSTNTYQVITTIEENGPIPQDCIDELVISEEQFKYKNPQIDKETQQIIDYININLIKEQKRNDLKRIRGEKISSNLLIENSLFQVREQDLENFYDLDRLVNRGKLKLEDKKKWVLADNTIKEFTIEQLLEVLDYRAIRKSQIFGEYGIRLFQLNNAKTHEEVDNITWE